MQYWKSSDETAGDTKTIELVHYIFSRPPRVSAHPGAIFDLASRTNEWLESTLRSPTKAARTSNVVALHVCVWCELSLPVGP
jgi:hypothetical protein